MKRNERMSLIRDMSAAESNLNSVLQQMEIACHTNNLYGAPARRRQVRKKRQRRALDEYVEALR